jgi:xylulokinase
MSYMGLDIGTTGCKAAVFSEAGRLLATAYREYPLLTPERGWAELDSARVCDDCLAVIGQSAAASSDDPVRGLGISCQGEAFTPLGPRGEILGNAMVSSDARAEPLLEAWSHKISPRRLYEITGHTSHPMFTLFKLLWLRQYRPKVWSAAAKFYCFEELLQSRLGLEPAISWPLAGRTMLFDVRKHRWDPEILAGVGLDPSRLAPPVPSGTVVGTIAPSIARRLGLPDGVLTVAGGHDQPCGALGAGVVESGVASGTVECISPVSDRPVFDENLMRSNLCTYDFPLAGMYTTVLFSLTGGNLLRWARDQWGQQEVEQARRSGADPYDLLVAQLDPEPTDLLVLPYFTPSGTPYFDAQVPGAILGLRLSTTRGQVLRALVEGVALEMRLNLEILEQAGMAVRELRAIGGGARNPALLQLKADVLDRPITTLAVTEAGCLGVALLACAAHRGAAPRELAGSWVKTTRAVEPDPRRAAVYRQRFAAYREVYPALRGLWSAIAARSARPHFLPLDTPPIAETQP